jgi:6-pyruvoyltetrahydropterin/6-carboxytetrahydropterin synthase
MSKFYSTKTYNTDRGLSCCFRQWRATHSHCSTLHGYSLGIKLIFESSTLDEKNWVFDFGGLKAFKTWADYMFDHTLVIAHDDPQLEFFTAMNTVTTANALDVNSKVPFERGAVCDIRIVEGVGCEMFAKIAYDKMAEILETAKLDSSVTRYPVNATVRLKSVEVFEHGANSAIYEG